MSVKTSFWVRLIGVAVTIPFLQTTLLEKCDANTVVKISVEIHPLTGLIPASATIINNHPQQFYPISQNTSLKATPNPKSPASNSKPSLPKSDPKPLVSNQKPSLPQPDPKPPASNQKPSLPKPDLKPIPATKYLSPPLLPPNRGPQIEPQTKPVLPAPKQRPAQIPQFPLNPWNPAF